MDKKYYLLCYTRQPEEDSVYSEKLAYSMHLALCEDGEHFYPAKPQFGNFVHEGSVKRGRYASCEGFKEAFGISETGRLVWCAGEEGRGGWKP